MENPKQSFWGTVDSNGVIHGSDDEMGSMGRS